MSVIATAVRHLMAAGVTGEALVAAIADMEDQVRAEPKPRTAGAARTQRWRDKKAAEASQPSQPSQNVTCDAGDADVTTSSLSLLPNENKSNPTTHTHEKQTPRARKGTRLPAEWSPKPLPDVLTDAVAQWPPGVVDRELDRFRDWAASATGPNAIKSDWDAAWRNWIRKIQDEGRHGNASNRNNAGASNVRPFAKPKDGAIAALDRRLGLDGSPGAKPSYDAGGGEADCFRPATGARRLFS